MLVIIFVILYLLAYYNLRKMRKNYYGQCNFSLSIKYRKNYIRRNSFSLFLSKLSI